MLYNVPIQEVNFCHPITLTQHIFSKKKIKIYGGSLFTNQYGKNFKHKRPASCFRPFRGAEYGTRLLIQLHVLL